MRCWWLAVALLTSCGFGSGTLEEIDPEAAPAQPIWSEDVQPLMEIYCVACHSPAAQPGEVAGRNYSTCVDTRRNFGGIRTTVFENNNMPPGGAPRVLERDRITLQRWAAQGYACD